MTLIKMTVSQMTLIKMTASQMTLIKMSVSQMTFSQMNTFIVVLSFVMLNVGRLSVVAPFFPLRKKNDWPDKIIGSNGEEDSFSSFQFVSCRKNKQVPTQFVQMTF